MSRTLTRFLLIIFALSAISATARAAGEPIAILHVYWNGPSRPDPRIMQKSLDGAFAQMLKEKLNVTTPADIAGIDIRFDGNDIEVVISSRKNAVQPTPDEIVTAVKDSFIDTVSNFFKDVAARDLAMALEKDQMDVQEADKRLRGSRDALRKIRNDLRGITHRVDVTPESLRGTITRIEEERDRLALDAEGQAVRKKAIESAIEKITATGAAQMKNDRIAVELEKLIASRETELKRMQALAVEKNVAQAEVEAAEGRLGEARVRLWERQEVIGRTAGGDLLAELNKELAMLSINSSESETRLARLKENIDAFGKAVELIDELETLLNARQAAEGLFTESQSRLAEFTRTLRQYQPPVVILAAHQ